MKKTMNPEEKLLKSMEKGIFFIEQEHTELWLTEKHKLTRNPNKAKRFESVMEALVYSTNNRIKSLIGYHKITEHLFV